MGEKIREHLKKFREAAGLTQKQLGAMAGKGESAIQAYESGKSDIPETEHCTGEKPAVSESRKQREVGSGDVF